MVPLQFEVLPETVGDHRVSVRAETVPGEILDGNNSHATYVKVVSGGVRVGFFDVVRPESKFIARSLAGAEHLRVRRLLVLSGQRLPQAQTQVDRYDVVILGDLSAAALLPSRMLELRKAVQQDGKGLVVLLSQESGGRGGWRDSALAQILPVRLGSGAAVVAGRREFRVAPGLADHPAVALAAEPEATLKAWAELPPLAGAVVGVTPKRGASVLATDQEGHPLLVVHQSGWGRVACVTGDTTFRWFFTRRNTQDYHRRFWRQLVMWAAGREEKPKSTLRVELSKQRLLVGERLGITIHLLGPEGEPLRDAQLDLRVTDPQEQTSPVQHRFSRSDGAYVAEYVPAAAGDYALTAEAKRGEDSLGRDSSHFHASMVDLELEDPVADLRLLRRMAAATEEAGGRYYHHSQADKLFEELASKGRPLKLATRRRDDVWDAWPLFAFFAACVVAEWTLRKWKGLV
jgi:uncharacterized membrane protein